jgi:hypothetical protein
VTNPLDKEWNLFANEAHIIRSLYATGFEELSRAGLSSPGRYIASLYSIGMSLERLGKLCYVIMSRQYKLDRTIDIKRDMGHNLKSILSTVYKLLESESCGYIEPCLSEGMRSKALTLVEGILGGHSRYFSIDSLTRRKAVNPYPLLHEILLGYYDDLRTERWATAIYKRLLDQALGLNAKADAFTWFLDLEGNLTNQVELFTLHAKYAIGCRGLKREMIELIKPLTSYLIDLEDVTDSYPCFSEFFLVFTNQTSYLSKLRRWSDR